MISKTPQRHRPWIAGGRIFHSRLRRRSHPNRLRPPVRHRGAPCPREGRGCRATSSWFCETFRRMVVCLTSWGIGSNLLVDRTPFYTRFHRSTGIMPSLPCLKYLMKQYLVAFIRPLESPVGTEQRLNHRLCRPTLIFRCDAPSHPKHRGRLRSFDWLFKRLIHIKYYSCPSFSRKATWPFSILIPISTFGYRVIFRTNKFFD